MATLLDTLKKNLGSVGAPTAPIADETGTVQRLLSAKKGIVGGTPTAPKGFSVAEAAARGQAQQQLGEVSQAAQLQSTALQQAATAEETQQKAQEAELAGQQEQNRLRTSIETERTLQELEQGKEKLNEMQRKALNEKVTALLRLQNTDYINNLQMNAAKARISEGNNFEAALAKDIFNNNRTLLESRLGKQAARNISDRQFDKELAQMGLDEAVRIAKSEADNMMKQAGIQTGVELAKSGVNIYGQQKAGAFSDQYKAYAESTREQGGTPVSFTTWQQRQGLSKAKGNLPAEGYGSGYGIA
jgi:hypothetical protein